MTKKQLYHIIEWLIALAACGYLVYRLVTFNDYAPVWASLRAIDGWQWGALALCVALMPVNMGIEAWRWKTLIPMSWREAHKQVYYSKLAGVITPWKLGEYPARAVLRQEWPQTLSMGAVGSATMTAVIIIAGVAAMIIGDWSLVIGDWRFGYFIVVASVLIVLGVGLWFAPQLLKRWARVSRRLVAISLGQSLVRLVCWCVQLILVLYALGAVSFQYSAISLQPSAFSLSFIYYLLVTVTPNVPIAEVGVRGAWAIVLFGSPNAALAGVLLWVINTLLPCVIWPFLRKKQ